MVKIQCNPFFSSAQSIHDPVENAAQAPQVCKVFLKKGSNLEPPTAEPKKKRRGGRGNGGARIANARRKAALREAAKKTPEEINAALPDLMTTVTIDPQAATNKTSEPKKKKGMSEAARRKHGSRARAAGRRERQRERLAAEEKAINELSEPSDSAPAVQEPLDDMQC